MSAAAFPPPLCPECLDEYHAACSRLASIPVDPHSEQYLACSCPCGGGLEVWTV